MSPVAATARVTVSGVTLSHRVWALIADARKAAGLAAGAARVVQGSYHGGVSASAGTHDGGGAFDLSIVGLNRTQQIKLVTELRRRNVCAWLRTREFGWNGDPHIHGIVRDEPGRSAAADLQIRNYDAGNNSLAGASRQRDTLPRPAQHSFREPVIVVKQEGWPVSVLKRGAFVTWWNSYSGKPDPKDIQTVAVDGKWHDVTGVHVDAAAVAGEEKHVLYLRCHPKWNSASQDGLYTEVRWLRDGGTPKDPKDDDATAYTPLYIPRFVDSFPWPALHLESGQAKVGGKWQVRFVGGASTVDLLTRYAKTHVIAPSD